MKTTSIALLGEYSPAFPPHLATTAAVTHSSLSRHLNVNAEWISTAQIDAGLYDRFDGIWVAPGSPYQSLEKTLWAIRQCREKGVPCLGTCGGFQHMIIEYARNVLGFADAQHAEYDPYASRLFIARLACSLAGREMDLRFQPDSQVAGLYGAAAARERYYCNFGVAPDAVEVLKAGGLRVTGSDAEGEIRVVELPGHPFFIGTLFVSQMLSTAACPHPLVTAFLLAAGKHQADRSASHPDSCHPHP